MTNDLVPEIVKIGSFLVDINLVCKNDLKAMRTYWPKELYRMIKNRKSARICRERRKSIGNSLDEKMTGFSHGIDVKLH